MKKADTKPEIIFDDFSLATTIAAGCAVHNNLPSKSTCGYEYRPGLNVFVDSGVCNVEQPDGWNGFCYHIPLDSNNLFNSL